MSIISLSETPSLLKVAFWLRIKPLVDELLFLLLQLEKEFR